MDIFDIYNDLGIGADYMSALICEAGYPKDIADAIADDVARDVHATADHEDWSATDVRASVVRIIRNRLNIQIPAKQDYKDKALNRAESIGVYEYKVNGKYMEYWSFYGAEGWYFVRYDLDEKREVFRGANIPWNGDKECGIPAFLKSETGATLYNYCVG